MKYSESFERDWEWYYKWRHTFNFDAKMPDEYVNKKGQPLINFSEGGVTAKEAFYSFDSHGKILSCREPELLLEIVKCKGSINFNIKQWVSGILEGSFTLKELKEEYELLPGWVSAIEGQLNKGKYKIW